MHLPKNQHNPHTHTSLVFATKVRSTDKSRTTDNNMQHRALAHYTTPTPSYRPALAGYSENGNEALTEGGVCLCPNRYTDRQLLSPKVAAKLMIISPVRDPLQTGRL